MKIIDAEMLAASQVPDFQFGMAVRSAYQELKEQVLGDLDAHDVGG